MVMWVSGFQEWFEKEKYVKINLRKEKKWHVDRGEAASLFYLFFTNDMKKANLPA